MPISARIQVCSSGSTVALCCPGCQDGLVGAADLFLPFPPVWIILPVPLPFLPSFRGPMTSQGFPALQPQLQNDMLAEDSRLNQAAGPPANWLPWALYPGIGSIVMLVDKRTWK